MSALGPIVKPISVSKLIKPRYVRKSSGEPKYKIVQRADPMPHGIVTRPCGALMVRRPVDLDRAMRHWADQWQHADPIIGFDDLNPCRAIWSRRDTGE